MSASIRVQVVYALAERQWLVELELPGDSTLEQAVQCSGLLARIPQPQSLEGHVGVFGQPRALDSLLRDGDRVEIYRPLICDPKEVRRQRAAQQRAPRRQR